jgi:hypothetical protein
LAGERESAQPLKMSRLTRAKAFDMAEPRKIDVFFADGHWLTQVGAGFLHFDCATLTQLIEAVQQECPDEALLFIVDYSTIAYHPDAESQFREASEKSGALIIASVQEF